MKHLILILGICLPLVFNLHAQTSSELFDKTKMEYMGGKSTQAKLLMRNVGIWGKITEKEAKLDTAFLELLNKEPGISKKQVKNYLKAKKISERDAGGSIDNPLSFINKNGKKIHARYFVIHDVSTPVYFKDFPGNINEESWSYNNPNAWSAKKTHTYLTRTGKLKTVTPYSEGLRATKFELQILGTISRGLFIHVELIQPRVYPPGNRVNAPVAPKPGFTNIQYQNLALLYVCSSIRKGEWMVPAFHVNIDEKLNDGHDDPQNFETVKFTNEVMKLVSELKTYPE